jgi:hypothetical protein
MTTTDDTHRRVSEWLQSFAWPEDAPVSGSLVELLMRGLTAQQKRALVGALALHQAGLDPDLEEFEAVIANLPTDCVRWLVVQKCLDNGSVWTDHKLFDDAVEQLRGISAGMAQHVTVARSAKPDAVYKSYSRWQRKLDGGD